MLHSRNLHLGLFVLVTFLLGSIQAAHAQQFNFNFASSGGFNVTGTLFTTSNNDGSYTANTGNIVIPTNSAGLQTGSFVLLPPNGFAGNDNLVFPTASSVVDANGLSFGTVGGYALNLYASAPYFLSDSNNNGISGTLTLTPAAVPEASPSVSFGVLLALGLGGFMVAAKRKTSGVKANALA